MKIGDGEKIGNDYNKKVQTCAVKPTVAMMLLRPRLMKHQRTTHRARWWRFEDVRFHAAHDVHFTGFAVEFQGEFFVAVDEGHRFGFDLPLYAGDALGLLWAEIE